MIQFDQVSKFYKPDIIALKDVSFDIDTGEFMFLVGPSGAGKSTLIRLLIRQELPSEGGIVFDDIDVSQISKNMLPEYRQQIGVVFQDYKLLDTKTITENIAFALEITGKTDEEVDETVNYLLEVVKLSDRAHLFPPQLSGGEKQRAGIARALANDPGLLIADEPTGNLDPKTSEDIMGILTKINSWGTTILIATHDREMVDQMKKRVVRLEGGELVSDTPNGSYDGISQANSSKAVPKKDKQKPQHQEPQHSELESTSLNELDLPKKILKSLEKSNLKTIGELLDLSEEELNNINGINEKSAKILISKIEEYFQNAEEKGSSETKS